MDDPGSFGKWAPVEEPKNLSPDAKPPWPDRLWTFCTKTRLRRLIFTLTSPIWGIPTLLIITISSMAAMVWEGDPGKLVRWIWTGKKQEDKKW